MRFTFAALLLVACADAPLPNAAPGYPCGVVGVECPAAMCCPQYTECRSDGQCSYVGPGEFESRRPVPQTPAVVRR